MRRRGEIEGDDTATGVMPFEVVITAVGVVGAGLGDPLLNKVGVVGVETINVGIGVKTAELAPLLATIKF